MSLETTLHSLGLLKTSVVPPALCERRALHWEVLGCLSDTWSWKLQRFLKGLLWVLGAFLLIPKNCVTWVVFTPESGKILGILRDLGP